jgi:DEAD/DEAH box helicase domain-containing protein
MNVTQMVERLRASREFGAQVTEWRTLPARPARYGQWPAGLDARTLAALATRGIEQPFTHQAAAIRATLAGEHVVVVTPTASGKTVCYNVPVLDAVLKDPSTRALYLFPTKALAQDQVAELQALAAATGVAIAAHTYDGDTPAPVRAVIRRAGQIVITNPDMLHTAVLPHHTSWVHLFSHVRYIVIDELHAYRGVFGSHLANVLRRLRRVCRFYGSDPRFILCSATIANPRELAERIVEAPVTLVDDNGAPRGEKHVVFYNPPVVNHDLGLRASAVLTGCALAAELLANKIQTIVFARSRASVELLLTYLRERVAARRIPAGAIQGYRGGYLPSERRAIERGLRAGEILGVVSTNALELGIDIGGLDACVMVGYPGTIASTWQQAGRAGRRHDTALAILVASAAPLDQYIISHPDYFFDRPPEAGLVNPNNLYVLLSHVKCAAFELPFEDGEEFGSAPVAEILGYLEEERLLHHAGTTWHWSAESFPAEAVSLRTASTDNFVIIDTGEPAQPRVIGEMDRYAVPTMLHEEAIYIHQGQQYQVEMLDWEEKKAYVRPVDVDYYTDANLAVRLEVLDVTGQDGDRAWGEVALTYLPTIFKKIKLHTHENVGWGEIHLPEETMHTTAYWLTLPETATAGVSRTDLEGGLVGLATVLANIAPLFLMCDPRDLGLQPEVRSPFTRRPTVFLYDRIPGGVGFGERLYQQHSDLLTAAADLVRRCPCDRGCPSCVGPTHAVGQRAKGTVLRLLAALTAPVAAGRS